MTVYAVTGALIGTAAERPAADAATNNRVVGGPLYIASDTGEIFESTGAEWISIDQLPAGTSLPGVTTDNKNGLNAAAVTAYPVLPKPVDGPIATVVSAASQGVSPLPAATYTYGMAYGDVHANETDIGDIFVTVTTNGTQVVVLTAPPSRPPSAPYVTYVREVFGEPMVVVRTVDATMPVVDNNLDTDFRPVIDLPTGFNQTYPPSSFGPTEIFGPVRAFTAVSEWNTAPASVKPSLISSKSNVQAQIDELVALFVAKGTLADNRVA